MPDLLSPCRGEDPRELEARLFKLVREMIAGRLPRLSEQSPDDCRRLGYLAQVAALLLGAPGRTRLLRYARDAADRRTPPESVIPLMRGSTTARGWEHDGLAASCGINPGLDIARYRSETAAAKAAEAPPASRIRAIAPAR